ncbi:amino acid adenylation domain-containing protein [Flavobacterium sp. ZT3R18]|uniref:non-ribosomal peptide synthetase n=1 Tax=Flavobacterium sp. ZT3R18 TaxID=2594429 RepID=UPI00117B6C3E|nr:non-ribosomal peptide synthetase [Flavobacterium sp. ZT3R18]TRX32540.1 amino acid adenylation domain-containing protein [Flavobacterium sp. ZT3R18]
MILEQLIDELISHNIKLKIEGDGIAIEGSKENLTFDLIEKIKLNKKELLVFLEKIDNQNNHNAKISSIPVASDYEVSSSQYRLWILDQLEEGNAVYNIPLFYIFEGSLDTDLLEQAFRLLMERHEILRTVFQEDEEGRIRQVVKSIDSIGFKIEHIDLCNVENQENAVKTALQKEIIMGFDLSKGPLLRASLLQLDKNKAVFAFVMHHIISDGWSMAIMMGELLAFYYESKNKLTSTIKPLEIQYKDYSAWQQESLRSGELKESKSYWLDQFSGTLPVIEIANNKSRPALKTSNGAIVHKKIGSLYLKGMKMLLEEQKATLFMGLLGVINTLLYKYSNQTDIIIGSPIAGREHLDLENQIGFYVNTLALRSRFKETDNFLNLLKIIKKNTLDAYTHQMYPFDELVKDLNLTRDMSRNPLFDVMVVLQNNDTSKNEIKSYIQEDLKITRYEKGDHVISKFDLTFNFSEVGEELYLLLEYNNDIYSHAGMNRLVNHLEEVIKYVINKPDTPLNKIIYLKDHEKKELLLDFNSTSFDYPKDKTILDLFEHQVLKTPDNIAVIFEDSVLSYKDLNELSNQLAYYLRDKYTIDPEDLIGLKLERSEFLLVCILGILKSGAAYLPIDVNYPQERVSYIEKDSKSKLILDAAELSLFLQAKNSYSKENAERLSGSDNLAYVIYTSGTTGNPKGVMVEHSGSVNMSLAQIRSFGITAKDKIVWFASVAFDASISEMMMSLATGASLCIGSDEVLKNKDYFLKFLKETGSTVVTLPPSYLELFSDEEILGSNLRCIITAGESANPVKASMISGLGIDYFNAYGPTECSVCTSIYKVSKDDVSRSIIPIGKPIANTQIYILDDAMELVPIGVPGKLYISGAGLARGYLNREELTAEKFISNPFIADQRMYDTGDLASWLADGNIEFLGRKDSQVKIRGFRIELGEIESTILEYPGVTQVVVDARNINEDKVLVAYVVADTLDKSLLRSFLESKLPDYMVPSFYVEIDAVPLTPNGKVNRKALPEVSGADIIRKEYVAPRSKEEKLLVSVWEDVLKRDMISVKDSFYNLGGDSIKTIQIVSRLKQQGYSLKIQQILRVPVLEDLAKYVELSTRDIDQSAVLGDVSLTPIQHYFFNDRAFKVHNHFNQSVVLKSREALDTQIISKSITALLGHHDALRMVYKSDQGVWKQLNEGLPEHDFAVDFYDFQHQDNAEDLMSEKGGELQSSFTLAEGPLFKAAHFRLKDGDRLALIIHHLIVDGVSWRILLEDFTSAYESYLSGVRPDLPLKTDSFQHWSSLQQEYALSDKLQTEKPYWESLNSASIASFPVDKAAGSSKADSGISFTLDKDVTELLQTQSHDVYSTEINDILLTGLGLALKDVFGLERSVLKVEGHGREDIVEDTDISRTVGWFTSVYPFVLSVSASDSLNTLVQVKESLRKIPQKGIGYGMLKYLTPDFQSNLVPSIEFNYLGDFGDNVSNSSDSLFSYGSEYIGEGSSVLNEGEVFLTISGMLVSGCLSMNIGFSSELYDDATIQALADSYQKKLTLLIESLSSVKEVRLTPSDLTYKELSTEALSLINQDNSLEDVYKLSPLQQGIYYHWLSDRSSPMYFEQMSYRIKALDLDTDLVKEAYDQLILRHGVLRTGFSYDLADEPLQIVRKTVASTFSYKCKPEESALEEYVERIKEEDRTLGFDLESASQMRLMLLDLGDDNYEFIWSHHHILTDGWCMSILIKDFYQILNSLYQNKPLDLPRPVLYSSYIKWLESADNNASMAYWRDYLQGYTDTAEIPFKRMLIEEESYLESRERTTIKGELYNKVNTLCTQTGITQNTFVQAVWGYLLSRYNNTNDVVFGSVVSGRPGELEGIEDMIGLFINTVPVRIQYGEGERVADLLTKVQEQSISGNAHHYSNLSEVSSQSELGANLINHILVFENYPVQDIIREDVQQAQQDRDQELRIESIAAFEQTNFDFSIMASPYSDSLHIDFKYNKNKYDPELMSKLSGHVHNLIELFAGDAQAQLRSLDYLTELEKDQLLFEFNDTKADYPTDKTIVDLFEDQVLRTPDHTAVVFEGKSMTYRELNEKSNQLANYLRETYHIQSDDLIGIKLERSELMIITILGTLKSGGAYVPIDINYPVERIAYIEKDSNCKVVLDQEEIISFNLERFRYSKSNLSKSGTPKDLAYIIYTSGTTGSPKGVMIEHHSLFNYLQWCSAFYFEKEEEGNFGVFSSLSFDLTVTSIYLPLIRGNKIKIMGNDLSFDEVLADYISNASDLDSIKLTPSHLELLKDVQLKESPMQKIVVGGESLLKKQVEGIFQQNRALAIYNEYGPTESTVGCIVKRITDENLIPIGKPIANTQIYILDDLLALVPTGVPGKLYISGAGLARGYLNREDLTAEKFISNPFIAGQRMYDTGDIASWLADGDMVFLGRKDSQVKIRGFRIELGEIESVILAYSDSISQAIVEAKIINEDKVLVAYLISEGVDKSALRDFLESRLPEYMIPSFFVELDVIPLTPNGKADRKALPDVSGGDIIRNEYIAPRTKKEKILATVWGDILKRESISIKDNFYNLGGDSIKTIQIISRLKQKGYSLKIQQILRFSVLEELAEHMEAGIRNIDQSVVLGEVPLTPIQCYFFEDTSFKVHHHYNQSVVLKSREVLDTQILAMCISVILEHHDALRMVYKYDQGVLKQSNAGLPEHDFVVDFYDLRNEIDASAVMLKIGEELQSGFDLGTGPLFKAAHFRLQDGDRIALIIHHLVVDGVSWRILLEDFSAVYQQYLSGISPTLPLKTDSFQLWSSALSQYALSDKLQAEKPYWESLSLEEIPIFPVDKQAQAIKTDIDRRISFTLDKNNTECLQTEIHNVYNTEINDVLLTALGLAMKEVFGLERSVIKIEGHGREDIIEDLDVSRTIGWFTTIYPFVLNVPESDSLTNLVSVKESLRNIPQKGIGYGVLKYLTANFQSVLVPSIEFNYLGDFGDNVSNSSDSLFSYGSDNVGLGSSVLNKNEVLLGISGMIVSGQLTLSIAFNTDLYIDNTIQNLADSYKDNLTRLINTLSSLKEGGLLPSALTLDQESLNKDLNFDNIDKIKLSKKYKKSLEWANFSNYSFIDDTKPNLVTIHEGQGSILGYRTLFEELKNHYNIWIFDFDKNIFSPTAIIHNQIPFMYAEEIRILFEGYDNVTLLGFSYGGYLGYLMTNYLEEKNFKIDRLYMIDTDSYINPNFEVDNCKEYFTDDRKLSIENEKRLLNDMCPQIDLDDLSEINDIDLFYTMFKEKIKTGHYEYKVPQMWNSFFSTYYSEIDLFQCLEKINQIRTIGLDLPKPPRVSVYKTDIIYFKAKESDIINEEFWYHLTESSFEVIEISGTHLTLMQRPNINCIIEYIKSNAIK